MMINHVLSIQTTFPTISTRKKKKTTTTIKTVTNYILLLFFLLYNMLDKGVFIIKWHKTNSSNLSKYLKNPEKKNGTGDIIIVFCFKKVLQDSM